MLVIRRLVDRQRAYTALLLPGEPPRIFPTSDQEHGRLLQIYKQDRPYPDVLNDFTDFGLADAPPPLPPQPPCPGNGTTGMKKHAAAAGAELLAGDGGCILRV